MKMKKIASAITAAVMTFSMLVGATAYADDISYVRNYDFNNAKGTRTDPNSYISGIDSTTSNLGILANGFNECSAEVAGDEDKCLQFNNPEGNLTDTQYMYVWYGGVIEGKIKIEFLYKTDYGTRGLTVKTAYASNKYDNSLLELSPNGQVKFFNSKTAYAPAKMGEWYHIAIDYDTTAGAAALYIDGEEIASVTGITLGGLGNAEAEYRQQIKLISTNAAKSPEADVQYIDDLKIYVNDTFDNVYSEKSAYIISCDDERMTLNSAKNRVTLSSAMTREAVTAALRLPEGAATAWEDGEDSGAVSADVKLMVISKNKKVSRTYTVEMPELSSTVYDVDTETKTISGVDAYTPVADFLNNLVSAENISAIRNGAAVTEGFVNSETSVLAGESEYTIVIPKGIIDVDFENDTDANAFLNTYQQHNTGMVKGKNVSVQREEDRETGALKIAGTKAEFDNGSDCRIQFARFSGVSITGSFNLEFSFKAEDLNSEIYFIYKDTNGAFGPNFQIKNGCIYAGADLKTPVAWYDTDKWYHAVWSYDFKDKTYTLYVNGDKIVGPIENGKTTDMAQYRIEVGNKSGDTTLWLDDIKLYKTAECAYDSVMEGTYLNITSDVLSVINQVIDLDNGEYTTDEVNEMLQYEPEDGFEAVGLYDENGDAISEGEVITSGATLAVRTANGKVTKYYRFENIPLFAAYDSNGAELTATFGEGDVTLRAKANNISEDRIVVVAQYDSNNCMLGCDMQKINENGRYALKIAVDDDAKYLKAFYFENKTIRPIVTNITLSRGE